MNALPYCNEMTLGAFRRRVTWLPGQDFLVWTKCARGEAATGAPWPHCHFMQPVGEASIYCPACRVELAAHGPVLAAAPTAWPSPAPAMGKPTKAQTTLPF